MHAKFLFALLVAYFISASLNFLIYSEGDFEADLSGKLLRAAITGLTVPIILAFFFWRQNRKKRAH